MKHKQPFTKQLQGWLHRPVKNKSVSPVLAYLLLSLIALGLASLIYLTKSNTDFRSDASSAEQRCYLGKPPKFCPTGYVCNTQFSFGSKKWGVCTKLSTPKPTAKPTKK